MQMEQLQKDMIAAMKARDKVRKDAISSLVSAAKKAAIDEGCRDNIPEELVNKMLDGVNLNYVKTVLEPSAGKGDIVQGLKSHAKYQNNENAFLIGMDEAV